MDPKKSGKKKRHSTLNPQNFSKNLEKLTEPEKFSKRKSSQGSGDTPVTLIDNNHIKSSLLTLDLLTKKYDNYELPKFSNKQIGPLKSFAYNTFQGLFKDYNEDKVSVNSLIKKPSTSKMKTWPKISYFGVFDGHGGEECSEFLKNNFMKIPIFLLI